MTNDNPKKTRELYKLEVKFVRRILYVVSNNYDCFLESYNLSVEFNKIKNKFLYKTVYIPNVLLKQTLNENSNQASNTIQSSCTNINNIQHDDKALQVLKEQVMTYSKFITSNTRARRKYNENLILIKNGLELLYRYLNEDAKELINQDVVMNGLNFDKNKIQEVDVDAKKMEFNSWKLKIHSAGEKIKTNNSMLQEAITDLKWKVEVL